MNICKMHPKVLQRLSSQKLLLKTLNGQYSTSQSNKNVIHSQYEDVFIPVENVADFCLSKFEPYSKLPALTCAASGKEFSYEMVKDLAKTLVLNSWITTLIQVTRLQWLCRIVKNLVLFCLDLWVWE